MARKISGICICLLNIFPKDNTLPTSYFIRGYSSDGRAPALQAGGHRFDPDTLHQVLDIINECILLFTLLSYLRQI